MDIAEAPDLDRRTSPDVRGRPAEVYGSEGSAPDGPVRYTLGTANPADTGRPK